MIIEWEEQVLQGLASSHTGRMVTEMDTQVIVVRSVLSFRGVVLKFALHHCFSLLSSIL